MKLLLLLVSVLLPFTSFAAVGATHLLTAQNGVGATSYTTASFTPDANQLVLACIANQVTSGGANIPTLTGNGLTWVQVATRADTETGNRRVTLYRALGASPSAGTLVIDMAGQTQIRSGWSISEFSGIETSGINGSHAILQATSSDTADTGATTGISATLGSFFSTGDASYGCVREGSAGALTAGAGFTALGTVIASASVGNEWQATNNRFVAWSYPSASIISNLIGAEIRVLGAAPVQSSTQMIMGTSF